MADEKERKQYVEDPIERTPQTAAGKGTAALLEDPIERAAVAPAAKSAVPEKYGFTGGHMLNAAKEGIVSLGRGALEMGHDVLTNPDWLVGQGKTLGEKLGDPHTTFNRFIGTPAMEEHRKAATMIGDLKKQSRTTGRAPLEKIVEAGGHELASVVPIFGPWAAGLGEQAGSGDIGGAVASGGSQALASAIVPKIARGAVREAAELPRVWRGLKALGDQSKVAPEVKPLKPAASEPARLEPIKRAPEDVFRRPIEAAPGAGKEPAPAEMHPDELADIRKEAGKPEMSAEEAHRFRVNKMAGTAAAAKPTNDLGGMKRAGDVAEIPQTGPSKPPTLFQKEVRPAPVKLESLIDQAAGVKPLKPDVPLREQLSPQPTKPGEVVDPIKAKYPDPAVRQMVRANGEKIYEAAKGKPETVKAIHDLTRVELRQALINAGEDMGQTTVSNSKFAGEGSIPREEAFNRLLKKGHTAEEIVKLATQAPNEKKPGGFMPEEAPQKQIRKAP